MTLLPPEFASLEPFIAQWAVEGVTGRAAARSAASAEELETFYAAARPHLAPALAYLDERTFEQFEAADHRLMQLMLSLANVSHAVEALKDGEPQNRRTRERLKLRDERGY